MDYLKIQHWCRAKRNKLYTRLLRGSFGSIGKNSSIAFPLHSNSAKLIFIGDYVSINAYSWLDCFEGYMGKQKFTPSLEIGDGTYIGHRAHIIACDNMKIGKNVLIADGVYISDNLHGFADVSMSILPQPLTLPGPVTIEDEVWLGENVCVLPNVTIGKHSVIGSNSVVTKKIPPYSVAVGSPAKVIKQYNPDTKTWEKVK